MSLNSLEFALKDAIVTKNIPIAKLLLSTTNPRIFNLDQNKIHININAQDDEGNTFLHYASQANCPEIVAYLLEQNIDINTKNLKGETPLHYAVRGKYLAIAKILVENRANLFTDDAEGKNLLHVAVENEDPLLCEWLLLNGINPEALTINEGLTPLDIAFDRKNIAIIELLSLFGCLSGKLLPSALCAWNLNLDYHFLVGSYYEVACIDGKKKILVSEKDKNCAVAITGLAQFQMAKQLLQQIKSKSFQNKNHRNTAYKVLLSALAMNWQFWLQVFREDPKPLFRLYHQLKNLDLNSEIENNYSEIGELLDTTEENISNKNLKPISPYDLPLPKIINKIEEALKIQSSKSLEAFLSVLQLHSPSLHLRDLIIKRIKKVNQDSLEEAKWIKVRQDISKKLSPDLAELIGNFKLENTNFLQIETIQRDINIMISWLKKLNNDISLFKEDLEKSDWPRRWVADLAFLIALLPIMPSSTYALIQCYKKQDGGIPLELLRILFTCTAFFSLIGIVLVLLPYTAPFVPPTIGGLNLFQRTAIPLLYRIYQIQKVTNMYSQHKESLQGLLTIIEDMLCHMDAQNKHGISLYNLLTSLKNENIRVKELIALLTNLHREISSMATDLETISVSDQFEVISPSNQFIKSESYHRPVSFFPTVKIESLLERRDNHRLDLVSLYEKPVIIVDLNEESIPSCSDEENNNNRHGFHDEEDELPLLSRYKR